MTTHIFAVGLLSIKNVFCSWFGVKIVHAIQKVRQIVPSSRSVVTISLILLDFFSKYCRSVSSSSSKWVTLLSMKPRKSRNLSHPAWMQNLKDTNLTRSNFKAKTVPNFCACIKSSLAFASETHRNCLISFHLSYKSVNDWLYQWELIFLHASICLSVPWRYISFTARWWLWDKCENKLNLNKRKSGHCDVLKCFDWFVFLLLPSK